MNDSRKRKLGQSMKPRGTNETGAEPEDEVSADAGQQDPENTPEPEVEEDAVGGGRLEPETVEKEAETQTFEKVANEVEKGADLAPTEAETQPSTLEEQLAASIHLEGLVPADTPGAYEGIERTPVDYDDITKVTLQNLEPQDLRNFGGMETVRLIPMDEARRLYPPIVFDTSKISLDDFAKMDASPGAKITYTPILSSLGQQPNGTFGLVVSIPEGYIEGIKLQAQLDNMTTEEWVSFRLGEYLESWFYGK